MTSPSNQAPRRLGRVLVNHLGFTCAGTKQVIVQGGDAAEFQLENMSLITASAMGEGEGYQPVLKGKLRRTESPLGLFFVGDFSEWTSPGIYRVSLPATGEHSYQFAITDGAFAWLPATFLNFVRNWRSGPFENAWRGPSHLDDARRTDDGLQADVVGGWYDAGDLRKWMVHSNLPALGMMDAHERIPWQPADWERLDKGWSPWLLEARWGLDFLLKMQDPASGMFYEDVGGGRNSRKRPGMSWWYENHSGCYADNADNRFTDNQPGSGDERPVRVQYNPVAQFTSVAILARAASAYGAVDADRARRCGEAAERGWRLGLSPDPRYLETTGLDYGSWTSVRSWRALAALALHRGGRLPWDDVAAALRDLIENFDPELGFWRNVTGGSEPYRGILHSAQPLIALAEISRAAADPKTKTQIESVLRRSIEAYVVPLSALTPFKIMPFGLYRQPVSEADLYRPWKDGYTYRFLMPEHHPQRINHGLAGHWTSWSHALALVGRLLDEPRCTELAWRQLQWLLGCNPFNASMVSGVGYNNPMPHSRFLGTFPGGFCTSFNGSADDQPQLDQEGDAQWNTTEYWMTPLSNALMALAQLCPEGADPSRRLGTVPKAAQG
jgi:glycosyl hydrolase family 9